MNLLDQVRENTVEHLTRLIDRTKGIDLSSPFSCITFLSGLLSDANAIQQLAAQLPNKGKYLYYFQTTDGLSAVEQFHKNNRQSSIHKFAKFNGQNGTDCLYVGSSKNLRRRFYQHCGLKDSATYSLQLKQWLTANDISLSFAYICIESEDQDVLQCLEDGLWRHLKPIFGKLGANNKAR